MCNDRLMIDNYEWNDGIYDFERMFIKLKKQYENADECIRKINLIKKAYESNDKKEKYVFLIKSDDGDYFYADKNKTIYSCTKINKDIVIIDNYYNMYKIINYEDVSQLRPYNIHKDTITEWFPEFVVKIEKI